MSRKKLFIENIFAYGFINILNKIIPLLLLPVITRMLPNASDYGVFNMYNLVIGFGTPFAILGLYDAMFREYFEKEDQQYRYDVTTTAQRIILLSSIIISITLIILNRSISSLFFGELSYGNIIIFAGVGIFLAANQSPIQGPTRMQNQRRVFIVSGLLSSIVAYGLSVLLIYLGYSYFGLIYANIITSVVMVLFFWFRNKSFFLKGSFNTKIAKELFKIGLPLLPTFLIYWIYDSMAQIMITNMLGTYELGIYAVGSKMGQVSQLIYAAFAGGYAYFKYQTMNDADQVQMNSKLFEYLGVISVSAFIFIYPFVKIVFKILFESPYEQGYIVASYLFLSPLFLMLFQVVGSQFIVIKKSYYTSITLAVGAVSNIVLNYFFIQHIGIEGVAIATLIGYIISIITVSIIANRNKLLIVNKKLIIIFTFTFIYAIVNRCLLNSNFFISLLTSIIMLIFIATQYLKEIKKVILKFNFREKLFWRKNGNS